MSLDNRYDPQLHRILFGGTVVHIQDIGNGEKIRALPEQERISEILRPYKSIIINNKSVVNDSNTDIREEFWYKEYQTPAFSDPFVFLPFLPVHINVVPAVNDYVHIIYSNWSENTARKNQFYLKGPISSMMSLDRENYTQSLSVLAGGPNVKPGLPLKTSSGNFFTTNTKGVFAEPNDIGLYSKGRSDIILKDNEVLIRSKKTPILNPSQYPITNTKRSFLQLSNFDSRTVLGNKQNITTNSEISEQIRKLVEYEIYYGLDSEGPFSGNINIYNLPGKSANTLTNNFTRSTEVIDLFESFQYSFVNLETLDEVADLVNKVLSGLNNGRIDLQYPGNSKTLNVTDTRFPFFYRPSLATQKKQESGTQLEQQNITDLLSKIKFPQSQKIKTSGAGLISKKNKYGINIVTKEVSYRPPKIENGDFGYAVLGSEKIFIVSNSSDAIPGKPKIDLKNSDVYGLDEPTLSGNYYESTNSMVRGEALKELLSMMVRFLLNHKHLYHREPPFQLTHETSPLSKSQLSQEFKLFDSKVLNQNIRIN